MADRDEARPANGDVARVGAGVEVSGGKGIVVGDYNAVFQIFTQAPPSPLSSLIRVAEFKALVDERTRNFVGRDFVFSGIDEKLADPEFPSGYIVIQGEPGIGKTALLGQFVKMRGCVHHFNVSTLGIRSPQAFLSNVCAQLIVRYGLLYTVLPPNAVRDGGFLTRLLTEAAEKPANQPILVAVDALDEAEDTGLPPGANRLFLPPALSTGVFFIVTTRPKYDYRLSAEPMHDIFISEDDPKNVEDVRNYIRRYIQTNQPKMDPRIAEWGSSKEDFVGTLTEKSEGNFMYLVHVLRDIRDGTLTAATVDDIQKLPKGLRDYYRRHWNAMRSADEQRFSFYQEPVICLLAAAREPVTVNRIQEWTRQYWAESQWDLSKLNLQKVADVVHDWREFLNADDSGTYYRIYHASFQDFLKDEVGLTTYHRAIADAALAKIPGFLNSP